MAAAWVVHASVRGAHAHARWCLWLESRYETTSSAYRGSNRRKATEEVIELKHEPDGDRVEHNAVRATRRGERDGATAAGIHRHRDRTHCPAPMERQQPEGPRAADLADRRRGHALGCDAGAQRAVRVVLHVEAQHEDGNEGDHDVDPRDAAVGALGEVEHGKVHHVLCAGRVREHPL
eukprot:7377338-Prymnesium_polylepis.3